MLFKIDSHHLGLFSEAVDIILKAAVTYPRLFSNDYLCIQDVLINKLYHSLAAIDYFIEVEKLVSGSKASIKRSTVILIIVLELTQVDIPDTLGELEFLRNYKSQSTLFTDFKKMLLYRKKINPLSVNSLLPSQKDFLSDWYAYIYELSEIFNNFALSKKWKWRGLLPIIDARITSYYTYILRGHVKKKSSKQIAYNTLLKNEPQFSNIKEIRADWIGKLENTYDLISLHKHGDSIDFLSPIFLLNEFKEKIDVKYIKIIFSTFKGVGLLNVYLDDILDVEEDLASNDANLYLEVEKKIPGKEGFASGKLMKIIINSILNDFLEDSSKVNHPFLLLAHAIIVEKMISFYSKLAKIKSIPSIRRVLLEKSLILAQRCSPRIIEKT